MSLWIPSAETRSVPAAFTTALDDVGRFLAPRIVAARLPLALTAGLLGAIGAVLLTLPDQPLPLEPGEGLVEPAATTWLQQREAPSRLSLRSPVFAGLPQVSALWSREAGGLSLKEDRLMAGTPQGTAPFFFFSATRLPARGDDSRFFVTVARTAAKVGLSVTRFAQTDT